MAKKAATAEKKADSRILHWVNEISAAQKREKDFRKEGQRILDIYTAKRPQEVPYNILFSNTETLLPALYSSLPRPVVQRRFKDADPIGKAAAEAAKRLLEFLIDTNIDGYETYDEGLRAATLDGLLPGRGVTSVKYDAELGEISDDSTVQEDDIGADPEAGEKPESEPVPYKKSELVCVDTRSWNRVYFGYARKWSKVPWVAYEEYVDEQEAERLFGRDIASKLTYVANESSEADKDEGKSEEDRNKGERKTACIYQIWDKDGGKKVRYVSPQYMEGYLRVDDDPLGLTGFFNCPKPMMFVEKANDLSPVPLYSIYESQAKELNEITSRIKLIVKAIKAKAIYDGELGDDIKNLVEAEDNELVPADKGASLAAEKGLQNSIWFWPVDQLVATLQQLYAAREQCKRVIFEVTGISDIIRGSSVASETATAQNIKSQWGTLRLKRLQKEVQRYARDLLRMMLDVAAQKFSEDTWAKMTGLPFATSEQRAQAETMFQAAKQAGQEPDAATMQVMQAPAWDKVLELLRNDVQRAYRIDIELNSTVEIEATEDKEDVAQVMAAIGQALNGLTPLVTSETLPFEAAQAMLLTIIRRFRFGPEVEDMIRAMKPPKPRDDGKASAAQQQQQLEAQKLQAEQQRQQAEMQRQTISEQNRHAERMAEIDAEREANLERIAMEERQKELDRAADMEYKRWEATLERQTQVEVARIKAGSSALNAAVVETV